ncbi:hypothetical protein [Blastococcus sp. CT_GayMR16]|uniref:hypothetical protein n=1 Tax=Blastococcus sp. CT_GayMR16 TaxID=2559607 RepID=UPI001073744B|nr:hypothetical protein [Blastococcus sp. CT_GayMR16]TFV89817.1 hypothetical protein E4P38_04970 [Blastococcus sp. CT_GayMR16]
MPLPNYCTDQLVRPFFPLSRDLLSIGTLVILAITPALINHQWRGYRDLHGQMTNCGALTFRTPASAAVFDARIDAANRNFRVIAKVSWLIFLFALIVVWTLNTQTSDGPYEALAPDGPARGAWLEAAHQSLWANPRVNFFGFSGYLLLGSYGVYIITLQNLVGLNVIWAYLASRHHVSFGADPVNRDEFYGWLPVRRVLTATYIEIAIHGVALAAVAISLPSAIILGPFLFVAGQWAITLPIYLGFPFIFARRRISAYKKVEQARLEASMATEMLGQGAARVIEIENLFAGRIAQIRSIPSLPFRRPRDVLVFSISLIADLSAVYILLSNASGRT